MEKVILRIPCTISISHMSLSRKVKEICFCYFYILGQIVEFSNPPQDVSSYTLKENEVKMVRSKYDPETGEFKGLYETIGYLVVRGSPEEVFFNYGYDREKSKVLYSQYKRRIPNSFSGTIFNRHREMIKSGEAEGECSNIYFFLQSITDWSDDINKYLNNVSIFLFDITQSQLNARAGTNFYPSKLGLLGLEKNTMADAVVKCLKHINEISNSTLICNAESLLSQREIEVPIDWVGENRNRIPLQKFKVSH